VAAARQALADLKGPDGDTAATTFVSVVAKGHEVTVCWRGDSRAYWLDESAPKSRLLTREDSEAGGMITADLVDDSERAPHVDRFAPPGAGSLLICSDGLWMYGADRPVGCGRRQGKVRHRSRRCRQHHRGNNSFPGSGINMNAN
jgi:serine/threonine protein phosphatase PrpC